VGVKGDETRARLIEATRTLVEAHGYFGTGLNQILAESGAPRGSMYFHFPEGKDALVGAALASAGQEIDQLVRDLDEVAPTALSLVQHLIDALAERMESSHYTKGCPLATVALEVAASHDALQAICAGAYLGWQQILAVRLVAEGRSVARADQTASAVLALIEGALLLSRARRTRIPMQQARQAVEALLT
jgi:TetR/AcrR family transcriptional repressor of lmrAB and yxaGH operons